MTRTSSRICAFLAAFGVILLLIPESNGVTPGDLAATVFWRFGVDPRHEIRDHLGRPFPIATGKPIRELFPGST